MYMQAEHTKTLDCEVMFTVVRKNDHYCGGTDEGMKYLQEEIPWLPYSFMGSLAKPGTLYYAVYDLQCIVIEHIQILASFPGSPNLFNVCEKRRGA